MSFSHGSENLALDPHAPVGTDDPIVSQVRLLTTLVSKLTVTLVIQGAHLSALRNGRPVPTAWDVDEAISDVEDRVPSDVADALWAGRDALLSRIQLSSV